MSHQEYCKVRTKEAGELRDHKGDDGVCASCGKAMPVDEKKSFGSNLFKKRVAEDLETKKHRS